MGRIDYSKFNYCAECKIPYPKDVFYCKQIGCHKKLRMNGTGHAKNIDVPRVA